MRIWQLITNTILEIWRAANIYRHLTIDNDYMVVSVHIVKNIALVNFAYPMAYNAVQALQEAVGSNCQPVDDYCIMVQYGRQAAYAYSAPTNLVQGIFDQQRDTRAA